MRYYTISFDRHDDTGEEGAAAAVTGMLDTYVRKRADTLQEARRIRDAVKLLFGDGIHVEIRSRDDRLI